MDEAPGDILVFLTGQDEIEALERLLNDRIASLAPGQVRHKQLPGRREGGGKDSICQT